MDYLDQFICLIFVLVSLLVRDSDAAVLNDYILDYQPLHFNPVHLHEKHSRVRRAADTHLQWSFKAYDRTFNLQLQPSKSVFTDDHVVSFGDSPPEAMDTSFIYEGNLAGHPSSSAFLSIINGSVSGHVTVPGHTTYHIEPAKNHFDVSEFHTIIYPESKMNLNPFRHKRGTFETCGSQEIYNKIRNMWQPVGPVDNKRSEQKTYRESFPHNKYSAEANSLVRSKRDLIGTNRTCNMRLQADNILYKKYLEKFNNSTHRAKEEIISLFAFHISKLNTIYENTEFKRVDSTSGGFRGIRFQLQYSKIMSSCPTPDSGFCVDNLDVSNFLDLAATPAEGEDFNLFCLVHTFTFRDFVGGTLGLAWVATADSPSAGVCAKYGPVRDSNGVIAKRNLNTGIVTLINFQRPVPLLISQLTFAHEVGHNFGSQHDSSPECAPYGTSQPNAAKGNYIMFPSATQGNLDNNALFSPCSKDSIARVLETLHPKGSRPYCFTASDKPFCGNNYVEGSEECDCGFGADCLDKCCIPSICKRNSTAKCSPSEGVCCNAECGFEPNTMNCKAKTECTLASNCNGFEAKCPDAQNMPDNKTFCNEYTKVCEKGECIASVCQNISWIECFMTSQESTSAEQMCYVSCKKNDSSECISSNDEVKVKANPEFRQLLEYIQKNKKSSTTFGVRRPAGSPCNDYKGYCDVFSKCRNVDAEGPFKQLTELIFNPVTLKNIRTWIEDHWWAVLLMCVGVVVFMGVFVKIFEYNTPSKNPKRKDPPVPSNRLPAAAPYSRQEQRPGAYSIDVPMYDRRGYGSQAYDNYAYQGPASGREHQYDRVSGPKNY